MKKTILFLATFLLLVSCMKDEDRDQFGFTFSVANKSGLEHENIKITIGGMQDGEFIGTESYTFPKILVLSNDWPDTTGNQSQSFAFYEDRWNPDLSRIKRLSERAYFMIQFEDGVPFLLYDNFGNGQGELTSFAIPENNIIKNEFGFLDISIEDTIYGDLVIFN